MSKEILLAWQGYNEKSSGTFADIEERTVVYLDTEPIWVQMQKDIEALKNRNRVLENINLKYREKLGISNTPMEIDVLEEIVSKVEEKTGEKILSVSVTKCSHDSMRMTKSGIWKCGCGYIHF